MPPVLVPALAPVAPLVAATQPAPDGRPAVPADGQHAVAQEGHKAAEPGGAEHAESIWPTIARLINFAILAAVLVYFARSPFMRYLVQRSKDIRAALTRAAAARTHAAAQMEAIEARIKALPGEIDALRTRGAEEIVAEEARIRQATQTERTRLLEQARREIDQHLRVAQRDLVRLAADLAVGVASTRIKRIIDSEDQMRLVDQYLAGMARGQQLGGK